MTRQGRRMFDVGCFVTVLWSVLMFMAAAKGLSMLAALVVR